jgi:fumarylacetoacetase
MIDFGLGALPYCSFSHNDGRRRLGVGAGTGIVDVDGLARRGAISSIDPRILTRGRLNPLLAAGRPVWEALHEELSVIIREHLDTAIPQDQTAMHLAWDVGDFVDFYSSRYHAENLGRLFRPDTDPLLPNWLHLPVGYHGRAGTVVVSGTPIRRPSGQRRTPDGEIAFGPSVRLDIELELGFVLGGPTKLGEPVPIAAAAEHLFGVVLVNDWSARDIQAWEYVPLGPFLGKSFATSVSAWVIPMQTLAAARIQGPAQTEPRPLSYLRTEEPWAFDLDLEIWMRPSGVDTSTRIATVNTAKAIYWNAAQQLAHLTVNGATVRPGDLFGSGTISGPVQSQSGSLLELTWAGRDPVDVGGTLRTFLEDGDEITLRGRAGGGDVPLGPVAGKVVSSRERQFQEETP